MSEQSYRVAKIDELDGVGPHRCEAGGVALVLVRLAGSWFAAEDRCPHMAHPLHLGSVIDDRLVCTWHHWEFDLRGDQRYLNPECRAVSYPVEERDGLLFVALDPSKLPDPPGGMPRN